MEKEEFKPTPPDYKGDGVSIWKATDKNGNLFLRVKILAGNSINCFKNEPKPEVKNKEI